MDYLTKAAEKAAETVVEEATGSVFNKMLQLAKEQTDILAVEFGRAFDGYLEKSYKDLNRIKTIADKNNSYTLVGNDGLFVAPQIEWNGQKYDINSYEDLLRISNNIAICGTGGLGKTMLLKYLFINAIDIGDYVPVYIRLRKYEKFLGNVDLIDYINQEIGTYNITMSKKQLIYCFSTYKRMLILFDGLDEVKHDNQRLCEEAIQNFQKKYPDNLYIVSSRHGGLSYSELRSFTIVELCSFDIERACRIIEKLSSEEAKKQKFVNELRGGLYLRRKDFASNPLLLNIMFITYEKSNCVSAELIDFYEEAFIVLYRQQDASKAGAYVRELLAVGLGMIEFKKLFGYLCFHSYKRGQYEFKYDAIIKYINNGINKLKLNKDKETITKAEAYLSDIVDICLIIHEDIYRFTHRSFQSYFSAYYVSEEVTDKDQEKFFISQLKNRNIEDEYDFYRMLWSLQGERFYKNILFPALTQELNNVSVEEMERWDKRQIVKFYIEKVTIRKEKNNQVIIFQRCNHNYKDSLLILTSLLNKDDFFTAIGLVQFFRNSSEWNDFFNELPTLNEVLDINCLLGERTPSNETEYKVKEHFCSKMEEEELLDFFIHTFNLTSIHNNIVELYKYMLLSENVAQSDDEWSDSL